MHLLEWDKKKALTLLALGLIAILAFILSCSGEDLDKPSRNTDQTTELKEVVSVLGDVEEVLRSIDNRANKSTSDGDQTAGISDVIDRLETVETLLESIDDRLASIDNLLGQSTQQSQPKDSSKWQNTRDGASEAMRAVIDALAECRVEGGYDVNGDGGDQVREWAKEAAWREATIYPERNNVSYWANLLSLFHCSTTDIEY